MANKTLDSELKNLQKQAIETQKKLLKLMFYIKVAKEY